MTNLKDEPLSLPFSRFRATLIALILALSCNTVSAAPRVDGQTISWPDDGWYQVQDAETYVSLCEGNSSCEVPPGNYIVINHTTGMRFTDIVVKSMTSDNPVSVTGNTISWPNDGWYQVQDANSFESICQGGQQCTVPAGIYHVINLTKGLRYEFIEIADTDDPDNENPSPDDPLPSAPVNAELAIYSDHLIDSNLAELIWDRAPDAERIVQTEIFRDDELLGISEGNSFLDSSRLPKTPYWYELVSVNADGERSPTATLNLRREQAILDINSVSGYSNSGGAVLQDNTVMQGTSFDSAVNIYELNTTTNELISQQQLMPDNNIDSDFSEFFGELISLDGDNLAVTGLDTDGGADSRFFNQQLYMYSLNNDGQWDHTQNLRSNFEAGRAFGAPTLKGNTLMVTSTNRDFNSELVVFEKSEGGQWLETSRLDLHRFDDPANWINDIDIEGETAILSLSEYGEISTDDDDYSAAVVLHRNDDGSWTEQQRLLEVLRPRGYSVSIEDDKIVVLDENLEVRLYEPDNNGNWLQSSVSSLDSSGDSFAPPDTAFNGEDLLIGFPEGDGLIQYGGYIQTYSLTSTGDWEKGTGFVASVPTSRFGRAVSLSGDYILSTAGRLDSLDTGYFLHTLN